MGSKLDTWFLGACLFILIPCLTLLIGVVSRSGGIILYGLTVLMAVKWALGKFNEAYKDPNNR